MNIAEYFNDGIKKFKKKENWIPLIFPVIMVLLVALLPNKDIFLRKWADSLSGGKYFLKEVMDQQHNFWILLLNFFAILALVVVKRKSLWEFFKDHTPSKSTIVVLTSLAILSTVFTGTYIVERHRVQSDESIYLAAAQNMYHNQKAGACKEGYFDENNDLDCPLTVTNFKAKGLALLYMIPMKFLGEDLEWIFKLQLVFYFLMFFATFYGIHSWTQNEMLSLITAAILGLTPTVMFQFRSSSVEPLYILMSLTALFLMRWVFEHSKDHWDWALFASFLGLFAQTRQETVFCLFAFGVFSLPLLLDNKKSFHAFTSFLTFFSLPILITISVYQGYKFQGGTHSAHGHFFENLWINLKIMVNTPMKGDLLQNPFLSYQTVLAILGFFTLCFTAIKNSTHRKWLLFLALYHIQSFMIFENVSGDFTININQRYLLIVLPTMSFLAAFFLHQVLAVWMRKFLSSETEELSLKKNLAFGLLILFVIGGLTYRHKPSFEKDIMYSRNHLTTEQDEIRGWLKTNQGRKLFIYGRPYHMIGYGHSSLHYKQFKDLGAKKQKKLMEDYNNEVYYIRGLDCWDSKTFHKKAVETRIEAVCDGFERTYDLEEMFRSKKVTSYPLYISKLHGKRIMQIQRDLKISQVNFSDTEITIHYTITKVGKVHELLFKLNGSILSKVAPVVGDQVEVVRLKKPVKGFYSLEIGAFEEAGRDLGSVYKNGFINDPKVVPLTDLEFIKNDQSWSKYKKNQSQMGRPLTIDSKEYLNGFGVHAYSTIEYKLNGGYSQFISQFGVDDEDPGGDGVTFKVFADGKEIFKSGVMKNYEMSQLSVDVRGVTVLSLQVDSLGNKDFDHADWIQPYLVKK